MIGRWVGWTAVMAAAVIVFHEEGEARTTKVTKQIDERASREAQSLELRDLRGSCLAFFVKDHAGRAIRTDQAMVALAAR